MSLPQYVVDHFQSLFNEGDLTIQQASGGDIHESYILRAGSTDYFLKFNRGDDALNMFGAEVQGLKHLAQVVNTPKYHKHAAFEEGGAYLLLSYYPPGKQSVEYWQQAGSDLAKIHKIEGELHGSSHGGYLGTIPLPAYQHTSWKETYIDGYLQPLVEVIQKKDQFDERAKERWQQVRGRIPFLIEDGKPRLLHGDLWAGNLYCTEEELPLWIDPSVRYGHREIDLSMTTLFGGFPAAFYERYYAEFPQMADGWEVREAIYHLYPLFAHVAMFGLAYLDQAVHTMDKIIAHS